jgi:hypothetical protein
MSAHERAILIIDWQAVAAFLAECVHRRVSANYASELTSVSMQGPDNQRIARRIAIDVLAILINEQYR